MTPEASHSVVMLGVGRPLGEATAEHLLTDCPPDADLSGRLVVTSGRRFARLLLAELAAQSGARSLPLAPPRIVTPAEVPGALGLLSGPLASDLALRLAWDRALRAISRDTLTRLLPRARMTSPSERSRCATILQRACEGLAGAGLRPRDAAERAVSDARLADPDRWLAMQEILDAALSELGSMGLRDPSQALLDAQGEWIEPARVHGPILLVGVPALAQPIRRILQDVQTEALVLLDEDRRGALDHLGCVQTDAWLAISPAIDPARVVFADTMPDQARGSLALIAREAHGRFVDEVTLGVCDDELTPLLQRAAERSSALDIRPAVGTPIDRTRPYRLLLLAHRLLADRTFKAFGEFLRHPDVERAARPSLDEPTPGATLDALDRYAGDHLPQSIDESWRTSDPRLARRLELARATVEDLLEPLRSPSERAASEIADAILALLARVYGDLDLSPAIPADHTLHESLRAIVRTIDDLRRLPSRIDTPSALSLLLASLHAVPLPPPPNPNAIETLGWLELVGDVGKVLVVCGFNEGRVSRGVGSDPILTEPVREALGMETDADRIARDTMILETLARTREALWIVVGSRSERGDPLTPSRLLFRSERWREIARRWVERAGGARLHVRQRAAPAPLSSFGAMPALSPQDPESLRASSFRDYLRSPYLFALEHLLRVETRVPPDRELAPPGLGTLLHNVLARLGDESMLDVDDSRVLGAFLLDTFSTLWAARVGDSPSACLRIQRHMQERVLARAGLWQAERRREGWRIDRVEWPDQSDRLSRGAPLDVDDRPILISGRIDRIDRHTESGARCVIDYKSGSRVVAPAKSHRARDGSWRDLQLPLYDLIARPVTLNVLPEFAYVSLDPRRNDVHLLPTRWEREDIDSAMDRAREVVREIRRARAYALGRPDGRASGRTLLWIAGVGLGDRTGGAR